MSAREIENLHRQLAALTDRVARVEAAIGAPPPPAAPDPDAPSTYVQQLAADGKVVKAIVAYRRETGAGLEEAKRRVEALRA